MNIKFIRAKLNSNPLEGKYYADFLVTKSDEEFAIRVKFSQPYVFDDIKEDEDSDKYQEAFAILKEKIDREIEKGVRIKG